jgi:4-hydroxybenzoate polyprenyltransferase
MGKFVRLQYWWAGKIPPTLAAAYLSMAASPVALDGSVLLRQVALFLVSCLGIGGFGHLLTDAFDVEEDRRHGKTNSWTSLPPKARWPFVALLLAAAFLPWCGLLNARAGIALVVSELLLFAAYAIPPVRLKERGFAGIVTDALYAYVLPVTVAWIAFAPSLRDGNLVTLALLVAWMLPLGMRHLARHQHDDLDRDRIAGLASFAVRQGRDSTMRFIVRRLLPVEIIAAALTLLWLVPSAPLLLVGFVLHVAWERHVVHARWLMPLPSFGAMTNTERHDLVGQHLLTTFVERWFAPLALVTLILHDVAGAWLVPFHLLVVGSPLGGWWRELRTLPRFSASRS